MPAHLPRRSTHSKARRHHWCLCAALLLAATPVRAEQAAPTTPEAKRVTVVPESVKEELREELTRDVLEEAKRQNFGAPYQYPSWTRRFSFYGDVRARFERDLFGKGNANGGEFPDFNAINAGTGFDVNGIDLANDRYLNVDQNRTRPRLRARFGVDVDVGSGFTSGLRIASGDGSTPVSTNQTLGGAPGNFSKYQVWLDRAFIRWQPVQETGGSLAFEVGRFENPFFTLLDFIWDEDVNFDGLAGRGSVQLGDFRPFFVAGAFPVFTTAFSFAPEQTAKFPSLNKWLYAGQLGTDWKLGDAVFLKFGAAFYYFWRTEGRVGGPCDTHLKGISCDSDESRPSFSQKGNTYRAIRTPSDAALAAEAASPLTPRYQYFGLSSHFRELVGTLRIDVDVAEPLRVTLDGEVVRNLGFKPSEIAENALNNLGPCTSVPTGDGTAPPPECGKYVGGRDGYQARVTVGSPTQRNQLDWNVSATYRYLESDAVVDAFADSDFGLGGTNLKGYILSGTLFVATNVSLRARWFSANNIVGPTYRADVFQLDLNARF
ncbi:MAG TPA: putative porin [Myxococcaceae bacterium]|nr:putative porin [Myxococcaceae bacterium]